MHAYDHTIKFLHIYSVYLYMHLMWPYTSTPYTIYIYADTEWSASIQTKMRIKRQPKLNALAYVV